MIDISHLNENQKKAVEWRDSSLLVLAGPGSGKTKVLTTRVAKIIDESQDENFRILCLTFTNKAANEMKQRLSKMVGDGLNRVYPTTFHAFCTDVLRQHGGHIGLKPDFAILPTDLDRELVLAESGVKQGEGLSDVKLLPIIDRLLSENIAESEVTKNIRDPDLARRVAEAFYLYKKKLKSTNSCDFPSLVYFVLELFALKPGIIKNLRVIYPHVCVDEFQDTNNSQYLVLKSLVAPDNKNLFVVADDDQIIYQWNGASPDRLRSLVADYKMSTIQLPANYRCPPQVIALANNLIQKNIDRSPSKEALIAIKATAEDSLRILQFDDVDDEMRGIADDLAQAPLAKRGSSVILARTTKLLQHAMDALNAAGVPAHLVVRKSEFQSSPMQWFHSMLRLANSRSSREQLRRICKSFFKLEGVDIRVEDVLTEDAIASSDLLRAWIDIALRNSGVEDVTKKFLMDAKASLVERLDYMVFSEKSFEWFNSLEVQFGVRGADGFADYREERSTWDELVEGIRLTHGDAGLTLHVLLQEIDLVPKTPAPPQGSVPLMTIHSSKGMEFKHVYLIGLAEELLPSFQSIKKGDSSRELQEERRNCFVAITRAEESLTLSYAYSYFGWTKKPSRFLAEMGIQVN